MLVAVRFCCLDSSEGLQGTKAHVQQKKKQQWIYCCYGSSAQMACGRFIKPFLDKILPWCWCCNLLLERSLCYDASAVKAKMPQTIQHTVPAEPNVLPQDSETPSYRNTSTETRNDLRHGSTVTARWRWWYHKWHHQRNEVKKIIPIRKNPKTDPWYFHNISFYSFRGKAALGLYFLLKPRNSYVWQTQPKSYFTAVASMRSLLPDLLCCTVTTITENHAKAMIKPRLRINISLTNSFTTWTFALQLHFSNTSIIKRKKKYKF